MWHLTPEWTLAGGHSVCYVCMHPCETMHHLGESGFEILGGGGGGGGGGKSLILKYQT